VRFCDDPHGPAGKGDPTPNVAAARAPYGAKSPPRCPESCRAACLGPRGCTLAAGGLGGASSTFIKAPTFVLKRHLLISIAA
jgi:hypothetical protein